jgi:hypothetical protein
LPAPRRPVTITLPRNPRPRQQRALEHFSGKRTTDRLRYPHSTICNLTYLKKMDFIVGAALVEVGRAGRSPETVPMDRDFNGPFGNKVCNVPAWPLHSAT